MPKKKKKCKTRGCGKSVIAKGLCKNCYQRKWRREHPEKTLEYERNWREQHPEEEKAIHKAWRDNHPGCNYKYNKAKRLRHPDKRNEERARYYGKHRYYESGKGKPYDDFEIQMILDKVIVDDVGKIIRENVSDVELAKYLKRSVQAIQAKRCSLKSGRTR